MSPAGSGRTDGLWPSEKLIDLMVQRWALEMSDQYELDEADTQRVREQMLQRWPTYLKENRDEIQPVLNEFIEMRMGLEPPEADEVRDWASRALPVFEGMTQEFERSSTEFKEVLNPLQKARFELEALKFRVGMRTARAKLQQWKKGEFDPDEFWEPTSVARRERREARRRAAEGEPETPSEPADQIALELGNWDRYVAQFAEIYDLDEAQRNAAQSILDELKERALAHRDRNREQINRLERRIADGNTTEAEVEEIKQQLVALYGPIDDMFEELKRRLEGIPTTQQRAGVEERQQAREERRRAEYEAEVARKRAEAERARAEAKAAAEAAKRQAEEDDDG